MVSINSSITPMLIAYFAKKKIRLFSFFHIKNAKRGSLYHILLPEFKIVAKNITCISLVEKDFLGERYCACSFRYLPHGVFRKQTFFFL